ncbi:TetR/AcrR family transcriptional regulator [Leifsonia sp. 2MCAF36]|uniref:TetR/AcrR family transcriptional regulator n=1 Tax=Leifsonia sp. 2MCAF36 TaxID=3232988 RepID=UPI003F963E00
MTQLRADAQDNRDRILASARALFSERGLDVGMREVARRAEIGPATLYRRFPTKQELIDEAFSAELRTCRQIVVDGAGDPEPWRGFTSVIRRLTALNVQNRGFVDAFTSTGEVDGTISAHREELLGMLAQLARRAQAAGALRSDFRIDDLRLVLLAGRGLSAAEADRRKAAAERFAELAIDAFRAPMCDSADAAGDGRA